MTEILEGRDLARRDRIAALRSANRFFWIDVSLSETSPDELAAALDIPPDALEVVLAFGHERSSAHRFFADGKQVVFAATCYLESAAAEESLRMEPVEVRMLVCGAYLLTLHREAVSLPQQLTPRTPEGRSEQYVVYAVVDAIIGTAFDALNEVELGLDDLAVSTVALHAGRARMASLRSLSTRLSQMRRLVGSERGLFERIAVELSRVEGLAADDESYFDRIGAQINRLVDAIDAAANAIATLIDLRLNETSYWLTVVATVFLPLTFITGFFGMNFQWMVGEVDSQLAFWLLGVGTPVLAVALVLRLLVRESPVDSD